MMLPRFARRLLDDFSDAMTLANGRQQSYGYTPTVDPTPLDIAVVATLVTIILVPRWTREIFASH
jgi:hypothetical protein